MPDTNFGSFQLMNSLLNKRVAYCVPELSTASINGNNAIEHTTSAKRLSIQLDANAVCFIS